MSQYANCRRSWFLPMMVILTLGAGAQNNSREQIDQVNTPLRALEPLRFLAADELMGRATMRSEIHIAARYISEQFRSLGLKECPGTSDYMQTFDIRMSTPPKSGTMTVGAKNYKVGDDFLELSGGNLTLHAPLIYAGFGSKEELDKLDIKGKIVVTRMGADDSTKIREAFGMMGAKRKRVGVKGGIGLIEIFREAGFPWSAVKGFFTRERPEVGVISDIPLFMINDDLKTVIQTGAAEASIAISDAQVRKVPAENVMGWVEGTDPKLKNEYIVLTAHYDHLGVAKTPKLEEGKMDSIYNGARDNAIGTTAVIDAARYFSQYPAKRSILFITYTGEEIGELGSQYFSENPTIPLKQLVYNLNIDNASYNDTSIITVVGLGRTTADEDIKKGCAAYGLTAMPDPAPEQDLFDRSDNVNLANKGVPAPTFSLGIRKFDAEINKRYHQLSDEIGNFNLSYGLKFINSFVLTARLIADDPKRPVWIKGDKYEPEAKTLYGK